VAALPPLRSTLDLMPSPIPERPGLLVRDPFRFTQTVLVIPPPLVPLLALFDGTRSETDLREALVRVTGEVQVGELLRHLVDTLHKGGFLQDELFEAMKQAREREFADAPRREAAHAGSAYPEEASALRETLARYMDGHDPEAAAAAGADGLLGIAAPHVSPDGGWRCYRAAYAALGAEHAARTFVILGTSHFGAPERFGLTRKPYVTPAGEAPADLAVVDALAQSSGAVVVEDYCHAVEHAIEFQVVFLQHRFGPGVRIVPILCGPFARATEQGRPEDHAEVGRFLEALADLARRDADRLVFVLGVDMAHVGRRYGDAFRARAGFGKMTSVEARDRERLERVLAGDADGFWSLVQRDGDPLRWCGASPLYSFLRAVRPGGGELLRYEQWNIDDASVVSFAGIAFRRGVPAARR
jgi:AmmeMemoRadiSam system protein B